MPKSLSDTRWASQANAAQHCQRLLWCYLDALETLITENQLDAGGLSDADGLLNGLKRFEFLVLLHFWSRKWQLIKCRGLTWTLGYRVIS
jgi:hypothetical protein